MRLYVLIATGMTFYGYALGDAYAYNHPSNTGQIPALDTEIQSPEGFRVFSEIRPEAVATFSEVSCK